MGNTDQSREAKIFMFSDVSLVVVRPWQDVAMVPNSYNHSTNQQQQQQQQQLTQADIDHCSGFPDGRDSFKSILSVWKYQPRTMASQK